MTKHILITTIFLFSIAQGAADIKYASSQEIEKMQQNAVSSLTPFNGSCNRKMTKN